MSYWLGVLNVRLNESEARLRNRLGPTRVNKLIEQFRAAADVDPLLFTALYAKRDPYRWLAQHWAPRHERMQSYVKVLGGVLAQRSKH